MDARRLLLFFEFEDEGAKEDVFVAVVVVERPFGGADAFCCGESMVQLNAPKEARPRFEQMGG